MNTLAFKEVLWDISPKDISELPAEFIIKRTLAYGTLPLIFKLIKENNKQDIKEIFLKIKETEITEKKYNYLKNYLFV